MAQVVLKELFSDVFLNPFFHFQWGPYVWKTYKEVYDETLRAGSALRAHGFEPVRKCIYSIQHLYTGSYNLGSMLKVL